MPFAPVTLTAEEEALRVEVREFLALELPPGTYRPGLGMAADHSPEFSAKMAARGWVGMAIPAAYGGPGRSPVDRFILVEELLAAGAPVGAHWVADRQTAPSLMAFGTDYQRRRFLPAIAAGTCWFSIGMSEPDSGSDLASVRSMATRVEGGWSLSGTKVWTSGAHLNHFFVVLCRTSPLGDDRHHGLSQLIVDLSSPGLKINPIRFLDGTHHFNEVVLDDVFVPDEMVLGDVGMGWQQVTSELGVERAGPDRFLSSWQLLETYLAEHGPEAGVAAEPLGGLLARCWSIRQLSLSVARSLQEGLSPAVEAAMVKDLGTTFEQEVVATMQSVVADDPDPGAASLFESLLAQSVVVSPSYTIRGGTTEVLRSVAARSLRAGPQRGADAGELLEETLTRLFENHSGPEDRRRAEATGWAAGCWNALTEGGLAWVGVPETAGGSGGTLADAACLVRLAGRHAVALPLAEGALLGGWLLSAAGLHLPATPGPVSVAVPRPGDSLEIDAAGRLTGRLERVPWGGRVAAVVALAASPGGPVVVTFDPARAKVEAGHNLAGEPRDTLILDGLAVPAEDVGPAEGDLGAELALRGALSRALLIAGATAAVSDLTIDYARSREQFGRPIATFQAVAQRLVQMRSETELAALTAEVAGRRLAELGTGARFEVAAAKTSTSRAASEVARHAHQVHGALGMTQEYPLHHFTRRLWSWRQEWGSERQWAATVGRLAVDAGAERLWSVVSAGATSR
jgi:alkylation response protein AidB-like acyl-CoA dehydrogenase